MNVNDLVGPKAQNTNDFQLSFNSSSKPLGDPRPAVGVLGHYEGARHE
jgi:hypothetical protein